MNADEPLAPRTARRLTAGLTLLALAAMLAGAWHRPLFMDEYNFLRNVAAFAQTRSLVPVYALYPTFYSYLIAGPIYAVAAALYFARGLPVSGLSDAHWLRFLFVEHVMVWTWVARLVTMASAAATIALTLRCAGRRFRLAAFLTTAALLVLDPFGLVLAHFGLPDLPAAFLVTAALFLCWRYAQDGQRRHLGWAAFLAGLAASAKLNGAFGIVPALLAPALGPPQDRKNWRVYGAAAALAAAGFLAGSPALLFAPGVYAEGFAAEARVLAGGHIGAVYSRDGLWILRHLWRADPPAAALLGLGAAACLWRRRKEDALFLALLLPALLTLGALEKKVHVYFAVVYPAAALMAGRFVDELAGRLRTPAARGALAVALILAFSVPFGRRYAAVLEGLKPDNTELARSWIAARVPRGAPLLIDWAYVPRLTDQEAAARRVREARAAGSAFAEAMARHYRAAPVYRLIGLHQLNYDWPAVEATGAPYLITSEGCYARYLQPGGNLPPPGNPQRAKFVRHRAFYTALFENRSSYRPARVFDTGQGPRVVLFERVVPAYGPLRALEPQSDRE